MIDLFWRWPQRDRYLEYQGHDEEQWQPYRAAAAKAGFNLMVIDADDVVVWHTDDDTMVYVRRSSGTKGPTPSIASANRRSTHVRTIRICSGVRLLASLW